MSEQNEKQNSSEELHPFAKISKFLPEIRESVFIDDINDERNEDQVSVCQHISINCPSCKESMTVLLSDFKIDEHEVHLVLLGKVHKLSKENHELKVKLINFKEIVSKL